jgi:hypothetical protein
MTADEIRQVDKASIRIFAFCPLRFSFNGQRFVMCQEDAVYPCLVAARIASSTVTYPSTWLTCSPYLSCSRLGVQRLSPTWSPPKSTPPAAQVYDQAGNQAQSGPWSFTVVDDSAVSLGVTKYYYHGDLRAVHPASAARRGA